ncbi:hypothetical protein IAR50_007184 [Cryptococcus sp. DSM 104548]
MTRRLLRSFARLYNTNFERRPTATLIVTNGALNGIADVFLHKPTLRSPQPTKYDYARTLRFTVFGMAEGPLIGRWMSFLERRIPMRNILKSGGSTIAHGAATRRQRGEGLQIAKRVLADQVIMAPIGLFLFVGSMGLMEGQSRAELSQKFRDIYWVAFMADWAVWPVIQTINFKFMPLPYRVPFQSTCGIAWTVYLSILNAKDNEILEEGHHIQHV